MKMIALFERRQRLIKWPQTTKNSGGHQSPRNMVLLSCCLLENRTIIYFHFEGDRLKFSTRMPSIHQRWQISFGQRKNEKKKIFDLEREREREKESAFVWVKEIQSEIHLEREREREREKRERVRESERERGKKRERVCKKGRICIWKET